MKCLSNLIVAFLVLITTGCDPVVVPDPIDPRLPKYTEKGYNVAGAFVNQKVWESVLTYGFVRNNGEPYVLAFNSQDSIIICFDGQLETQDVAVKFHLKGLHIQKFSDLINLNDTKIQLDGTRNAGTLGKYTSPWDSVGMESHGAGQLYIKKVVLDDSLKSVIFSGTFGFNLNNPITGISEVSYGRFDYRLYKNGNFLFK